MKHSPYVSTDCYGVLTEPHQDPQQGGAEGGTRQKVLVERLSEVLVRTVKDETVLTVVADKMMGNVPTVFICILLGDFLHRASIDELLHFALVGLSLLGVLQETPLCAAQHGHDRLLRCVQRWHVGVAQQRGEASPMDGAV